MTDRKLDWLTARPIAHRGYHDGIERIENSRRAFEAAIDRGYAIECDVHPTRDGRVAVFHDDTLDRLTEAEGPTRERTMTELERLRLSGTPDTIVSLDDTLSLVAGRVPIVIELKGFGPRQEGFVAAVARALNGYTGDAAIMSFDQHLVRDFVTNAPNVPHGLTAEGSDENAFKRHAKVADMVDFLSYSVSDLPNPFANAFRTSGRPVITWTVRTPEQVALTREHADQMTFEGFVP